MTKKIKGNIHISRPSFGNGDKKIVIEVEDQNAVVSFLNILIDYDKFTMALTGCDVDCEFEVRGLDKVGKVRESMKIEAELPKDISYHDKKKEAAKACRKVCPEGWEVREYFNAQSSFIPKDGVEFARTAAYRWVEEE